MHKANQKKIVRLLGVGFDGEDGHVRITKGENFDVLMGSDESHDYLQQLINKIENELQARNLKLDDLSPEAFTDFMQTLK